MVWPHASNVRKLYGREKMGRSLGYVFDQIDVMRGRGRLRSEWAEYPSFADRPFGAPDAPVAPKPIAALEPDTLAAPPPHNPSGKGSRHTPPAKTPTPRDRRP